jgi:hypothetical protein
MGVKNYYAIVPWLDLLWNSTLYDYQLFQCVITCFLFHLQSLI